MSLEGESVMGIKLFGIVVAVALLVACGELKTIEADGNIIVSIQNESVAVLDTTGRQAIPMLPDVPPGRDLGPEIRPLQSSAEPLAPSKDSWQLLAPNNRGVPEEADLLLYPYNTTTRTEAIFPSTPAGFYSQCTAQFVGASDVLLTAAHCVFDNDKQEWIRQYLAKRGYRNGNFVEQYDWECAAIFSGWTSGNYRRDYAFVKMRSRAPDWMGLGYSIPSNVESVGYPRNYNSNEVLMRVSGTIGQRGGVTQMLGNPMSKGSSGGAWHTSGTAVSVNSFAYTNDPNSMWGPTFDGDTRRLFDYVQSGCMHDSHRASIELQIAGLAPNEGAILVDDSPGLIEPFLSQSDAACDCGNEFVLINPTSQDYQLTLRITAAHEVSQTETRILRAGQRESLGCPARQSAGSCTGGRRAELTGAARLISEAGLSRDKPITPEWCRISCLKKPIGRDCARLGVDAASAVAPLAGFINEDLHAPPKDGVVATKSDLVLRFGGDPAKSNDPCIRGDFIGENGVIWNRGLSCRTITGETDADKTRLSLQAPSYSEATPVANSSQTLFSRRDAAPSLTFAGPESGEFQTRYGGRVISAESVSKQLIVTTEKGCVIASEAGPKP